MTISSTANRISYAGDDSTTEFSFPYLFLANNDLVVILVSSGGVETTKTITTHYTVSGAGVATGGTVTMVTAPATGETLVIIRTEQFTQGLDLVENDPFPSDLVEQQFDILTMLTQQLNTELGRAAKLSDGDTSGFDPTLPSTHTANTALIVNSDGDGFTVGPASDEITNAQTYATNASASAAAAAASETAAGAAQTAAEAAQTAAVAAANGFTAVTAITTGTTNLETTDARTYYKVDASGGTVTINLPAIGTNDGLVFVFEVVNVDNAITVVRDGTDYINDVNGNYTGLDTVGKTIQFIADDNTPDNWVTTVITQVPQATTSEAGKVELAIASEVNTGTDATRAVTPDALAGSNYGTAIYQVMVFNDANDCVTGDGAGDIFLRIPSTLNGFDLVGVAASCQTAGTTGTMDIQIHNVTQAADMLTTKITIDSAETDSSTAATPAAIDTANDDVATGDQLRIDVDAAHTTAAKGLLVEMQFRLP
jgi:hypothetical protein